MKLFRHITFLVSLVIAAAGSALGADTAVMTVTLHRLDDNNTTNQIFWDQNSITLGGITKWFRADAYIVIESTVTGTGGIQVYTNNGPSLPAGLVSDDNQSALPVCWRIWGGTLSGDDLVIQEAVDHSDLHRPDGWKVFMWVKDKNESGFPPNGDANITVKRGGGQL